MQFIKDHLTAGFEAFSRAFIRFWDNRFKQDDIKEYYRMQIEALRLENKELQDRLFNILSPKTPIEMPDEPIDWKPMPSQVPWHVKRQQLELESLNRARQLAAEASKAISKKSTEQLEQEVGIS